MRDPTASENGSTGTGIRRLVETYTPDGTLGRLGLGAVTAPVGVYSLIVAVGFLLNPALVSWLLVPTAAAVGVALVSLTLLTLWPVYLSLIGRIDRPTEYADAARSSPSPSPSPVERLKEEYRRGRLSEEEFENALEAALEAPERSPSETGHSRRSRGDRLEVEESERSG
ncbi:hypothetical protein [Natronobeatus ordinarius]|uniref:hypothetical protein n=1 Tax=Natronobeatus ordinarius TaxID=2963433 RepID=UPI0020CD86C2|nr:hypothetical protein [Natronobeatus ordinarius]